MLNFDTDYTNETDIDATKVLAGEIDIMHLLLGGTRVNAVHAIIGRVRNIRFTTHEDFLIRHNVNGLGDHMRRLNYLANHAEDQINAMA